MSTTATLLSLVVLEGSFRLFFGRATPKAPIYPGEREPAFNDYIDPLVGWKMPPNIEIQTKHLDRPVTYRSNSQGFRDSRAFDVADNRCRIVFLGDSFTFGTGVEAEETFAARVEAELGIRSYNLGVTGFGIDQMLLTLRHYGLQLKPDLVVISFIWDDLNRSLTAYRWRGGRGGVEDGGWWSKPVFQLQDNHLVPLTEQDRPNALVRSLEKNSYFWWACLRAQRELSRSYACGYRWRLNEAIFRAIRDDCRRAEIPLVAVHIPQRSWLQVPSFEGLFERLGVPFVDLASRKPANADALFLQDNPHFNAEGHRFATRAIIDRLRDLDWEWTRGGHPSRPVRGR